MFPSVVRLGLSLLLAGLSACSVPVSSEAGQLASLSLINSRTGEHLPVWQHRGQLWVAGRPGDRYRIQIHNHTGQRLLAVVAVDGVNVISGATASVHDSGYVLDPWLDASIDGWRKSMDEVAAFFFTSVGDSYAGRTGRAAQAGVIGVALYREYVPPAVAEAPAFKGEAAASVGAADAAEAGVARQRSAPLGTGHGERLNSAATHTDFVRRQSQPDEVLTLYYDSYARLQQRGIIPRTRPASGRPQPFPGDFVPDPG